jgi:Na+/H+-translocating membrane pyrophosphatase
MSETVKATIIGTIIIGIFMLISVKICVNTAWTMARSSKAYIEEQKVELKRIVKEEKHKAADIVLKAAETESKKK